MELREEFKKETGLNTIITGTFDDDVQVDIWNDKYIEWLESELKKLRVADVIGRFCECRLPHCKTKTVYICEECDKPQNC